MLLREFVFDLVVRVVFRQCCCLHQCVVVDLSVLIQNLRVIYVGLRAAMLSSGEVLELLPLCQLFGVSPISFCVEFVDKVSDDVMTPFWFCVRWGFCSPSLES